MITEITRRRIAELLGFDLHGAGTRPSLLSGLFELASIENFLLGPSKMELLQKHAVAPGPDWSEIIESFRAAHLMRGEMQKYVDKYWK